jgi:hypothetical protein
MFPPDVDFLISGLTHRTIIHSILIYALSSIPFLFKHCKKTFLYLMAVSSHSFVDYLGAPTESLWPFHIVAFYPVINVALAITITNLELAGFLISLVYMFKVGGYDSAASKASLFEPFAAILVIEILGVLLFGFEFPYPVPTVLLVPHLVYLLIFSASILADLWLNPFK